MWHISRSASTSLPPRMVGELMLAPSSEKRPNTRAVSVRQIPRKAVSARSDAAPISNSKAARARPVSPPVICHLRRRSEEHTSELQSRENLVCRLLLEKKKVSLQVLSPLLIYLRIASCSKSTELFLGI